MTANRDPGPPRTALSRRYVRYLLSFFVSVAVGLAPLLGEAGVPLFTTVLDLYPLTLRRVLIPFAALLMGLAAIGLEYFAMEKLSRTWLRTTFRRLLMGATGLLAMVYVVYTFFTERVPFNGGQQVATYVVGWSMKPNCACAREGKEIGECVGATITMDPRAVEQCYPRMQISAVKLALSFPYLALMGCLGSMVSILILRQSHASTRSQRGRLPN